MEQIHWFVVPSPFLEGGTITVHLCLDALTHIFDRHISDPTEPWPHLLGDNLFRRLAEARIGSGSDEESALAWVELCQCLEREVSLGFQLCCVAERRYLRDNHLDCEVCYAFTPTGLQVVLHRIESNLQAQTAYFARPGLRRGVHHLRRWEEVMLCWLDRLFGTPYPTDELPPDAQVQTRPELGTYLTNIRHRPWENWQDGRGPEGEPWRGPLNLAEPFPLLDR